MKDNVYTTIEHIKYDNQYFNNTIELRSHVADELADSIYNLIKNEIFSDFGISDRKLTALLQGKLIKYRGHRDTLVKCLTVTDSCGNNIFDTRG